ncbi:translation elongation factor-like protein [bacterium SM23_31]|nr:MAG: translation elongation factor-like protein [bacterium SM23_31]
MNEQLIGEISHYWGNIEVAGIEITDGELRVGDEIHIKGITTDFTQKVDSMQIEMKNIEKAQKGDSIGLKVAEKVRENDKVYKVIP